MTSERTCVRDKVSLFILQLRLLEPGECQGMSDVRLCLAVVDTWLSLIGWWRNQEEYEPPTVRIFPDM